MKIELSYRDAELVRNLVGTRIEELHDELDESTDFDECWDIYELIDLYEPIHKALTESLSIEANMVHC